MLSVGGRMRLGSFLSPSETRAWLLRSGWALISTRNTIISAPPSLLVLWGFSKANKIVETVSRPLVVFGREPLFMYVTHLALYMLVGKYFAPHGMSIPAMLPYWLLGLMIVYPLALLYGRFKQKQSPQSIWRFL